MSDTTWTLAVSTIALAVVTTVAAIATCWLAIEARKSSFRQIGVQTWLSLQERFDSREMRRFRAQLAAQCAPYISSKHDEIVEAPLLLFESIGTVYKERLMNKRLALSAFGWFATRWWEAAKPYIDEERKRQDDKELFEDFEKFAEKMREHDPRITQQDVSEFLEGEKRFLQRAQRKD